MVPSRSLPRPGDAENGGTHRDDPTRVATDFFGALTLEDWEGAVRFVAPSALAAFRESQLALFVSWAEQRDTLTRARAEKKAFVWTSDGVLRAEQLERHGDVRLHAFAGAPTLRELAAMPADAFAARFLAAVPGGPTGYRVLGNVLEDETLAHVLYRPIQEGYVGDPLDVAVLRARRDGDGWRVLLNRELSDSTFILFHLDEPDEPAEGLSPPG